MAQKPSEPPHLSGQLSFLDDAPEVAATVPDAPLDAPTAAAPEPVADDGGVLTGPNTRVRASNVMHRARAGAVRGALETIARRGIRGLTMVEAADRGGLARATLYNHVRDKEALLTLVLDAELRRLADRFAEAADLERGLADVADAIAEHPALVGIRAHDALSLATLAASDNPSVRTTIAEALQARGCATDAANVDLVLRWLTSFLSVAADAETRRAQAAALARTLH